MRKLTMALGCLVLGAAFVAAACGDDEEDTSGGQPTAESGAQAIEVVATDFAFEPTEISAEPGQAINITLKNEGAAEHSFTIDDLDVDTEAGGGEEATTELTAPGESVEFYCRYHPTLMRGMIKVGASGAAAPTEDSDGGGYIGY